MFHIRPCAYRSDLNGALPSYSYRKKSQSSFSTNVRHASSWTDNRRFNPKFINITDTTMRDGLQAFPGSVATSIKIQVIDRLAREAGMQNMEIGSFVNHKAFPNLADTRHLFKNIIPKLGTNYWALVPNLAGLREALDCGAHSVSFPTTVSETFSLQNTRCSVAESLKRLSEISNRKKTVESLKVRAYISCCPICPIEGNMSIEKIANVALLLFQMNCNEIFPSDTVGQAKPDQIKEMLIAIKNRGIPMDRIGLHLHGQGTAVLDNVQIALKHGVRSFDSSMGELGGCPVVGKDKKGNIPTEELVSALHKWGYETGINLEELLKIRNFFLDHLGL